MAKQQEKAGETRYRVSLTKAGLILTIYRGNVKKSEIKIGIGRARATGWALLCFGVAALMLSVVSASSVLAFIGLGLIFWGTIASYIRSEDYVKESLLGTTVLPSLETTDQMIREAGYSGKAVYLPPSYFKSPDINRAYIPRQNTITTLPPPKEISGDEEQFFVMRPRGILVVPPGDRLVKLFEETLKTELRDAGVPYLQESLQILFVEDLELARDFTMEADGNVIRVKIEGSSYGRVFAETAKLPSPINSLGCPLSSSIACALAKATGKAVVIEAREATNDGKKFRVDYRLVDKE